MTLLQLTKRSLLPLGISAAAATLFTLAPARPAGAQDAAATPTPGDDTGGHHWRHHGAGGGGGPLGHFFGRAKAELGLTDAQLQAMRDILKAARPQLQPLIQQMIAEKQALRALVQAPTIDEPAIRAQSAKVAAVAADLAVQHAKIANQFRNVLTPEQIQKVQDFQSKMNSRAGGFVDHLFDKLGG